MEIQTVLLDMFFCIILIGFMLSFILYRMFSHLCSRFKRSFNRLHWVKTENGRLYRASNGVYTTKERCFEISQQFKLKRKDAWIKRHERILAHLKKDD